MQNKPARKTGMARLLELAFTRKALASAACVLSAISVLMSFLPFIALYYIVRELVVRFGDLGGLDGAYMTRLGWLAAGGAAGAILINWAALLCSHVAAFTTIYGLKLRFTAHIAALPLGFHTENSTGKLRKIVEENIEKLEGFIAHQLPDLAGSIAAPAAALAILFVFDWRLGIASFIPIILSYLIQMAAFGSKAAMTFIAQYQNSLEDMNNAAVEYVRGISVVKAFNQTIFSFRKFHQTIKTYGAFVKDYTMSFGIYMTVFLVIMHHIYIFLLPVIILLSGGAGDYANFALSAVFYLIFSFSLASPFMKLLYTAESGRQIADGIERMDRALDVSPLPEPASPRRTAEYTVSFEGVDFSYNRESAALKQVRFTAKQGEITALVGPSSSGKSTIAHLIPRFYDVTSGAVTIGGVDIRDMTAEYLMSLVSFVFQDVFLFKQSVADNILVGNRNAAREEVIAAAKAAGCHEFIERLPQGYDTVIGSKNAHLSGGERQRIVIARAIIKNAPILVLDEATAFADPENEHQIHRAFEQLMKNKTVIVIAHRLSTVRGADKIVAVEKGAVVEEGRHDDLAAAGGLYSRMWKRYTQAAGWTLTAQTKEAVHG